MDSVKKNVKVHQIFLFTNFPQKIPGVPKVARSHLNQCSKSCDLQLELNCAIREAQGVLPCVGWGVRPVNWIYRL